MTMKLQAMLEMASSNVNHFNLVSRVSGEEEKLGNKNTISSRNLNLLRVLFLLLSRDLPSWGTRDELKERLQSCHFQVLTRPSPGSERRTDNNSSSLGLMAGLPASILAVVLVGVLVYRRRHLK